MGSVRKGTRKERGPEKGGRLRPILCIGWTPTTGVLLSCSHRSLLVPSFWPRVIPSYVGCLLPPSPPTPASCTIRFRAGVLTMRTRTRPSAVYVTVKGLPRPGPQARPSPNRPAPALRRHRRCARPHARPCWPFVALPAPPGPTPLLPDAATGVAARRRPAPVAIRGARAPNAAVGVRIDK